MLRFHWDSEIIAAALCPELSVRLGLLFNPRVQNLSLCPE